MALQVIAMIRPDTMKLFRTLNELYLAGWSTAVVTEMAGFTPDKLRKMLNFDEYNYLDQMRKFYSYHRKRTALNQKMPNFLERETEDLH